MYLVNTTVNKINTAIPVLMNVIRGKGRHLVKYAIVITCHKK